MLAYEQLKALREQAARNESDNSIARAHRGPRSPGCIPGGYPQWRQVRRRRLARNQVALLTERSRETPEWAAPLGQQKPVGIPSLHLSISAASGAQFTNSHYEEAVFNAFKAIEDRIQTLTNRTDIGKTLMANVFHEQSPTLDITHDKANAKQKADEAEGFKFLFMGATQGLRNPRATGPARPAASALARAC
jgi:uncharacterized protein (TIGR02391 family)